MARLFFFLALFSVLFVLSEARRCGPNNSCPLGHFCLQKECFVKTNERCRTGSDCGKGFGKCIQYPSPHDQLGTCYVAID